MASLEPVLTHDTAGRALNRARLMKLLKKEWLLCRREKRSFTGLTYPRSRVLFNLEYGYIPTIGNRYRECKVLGWVYIIKDEEDGLNHVYPSDMIIREWETTE